MRRVADNTAAITEIQEILDAGATMVVIDGQTVRYDFTHLRRRLVELQAADDTVGESSRQLFNTLDLSGNNAS